MKLYKCHKVVQSGWITEVDYEARTVLLDDREVITPPDEWWARSSAADPLVGGYYVIYDDRYASWSPAEPFEQGYSELPLVPSDIERDIGWAVWGLRQGHKITRAGWNGPGQFLELQVPDEHSKMSLPYVFITTVQGDRIPWLASQADLLALDWMLVD